MSSPYSASLMERYGPPTLKVVGTIAAVGLVTFGLLWNTLFAQMPNLPSREALWELNREPSVEFIDAKGKTIAARGPRYGRAVSLQERRIMVDGEEQVIPALPTHVVNAFIAAEDKNFLAHKGIDYGAIFRATMENVRAGRTVQGGSTITQQLVKNLFLTPDQTIKRKAQEARLAGELELMLKKEEILELYLNRVYFGERAYGLDAAAHTNFGKAPYDLTIAEAAMLAAFLKAPSRLASQSSMAGAKERQHYVLDQMVEAGYITAEQSDAAKRQQLEFRSDEPTNFQGHVLDYAYEQVHQILREPPPDLVIKLSLDLDLQSDAQKAMEDGIATLGKEKKASEGAAILVENETGAIRAMVGGRDYAKSKFNRATQARRQPGSSFKMFVWAAALETGIKPSDVRYDMPIRIGKWEPQNYGGDYRGAVTLSEALADSLNTISAQLGTEIGIEKVVAIARRFGVQSVIHNYPSITLGTDEVTLLDMTTGYGVLAKNGRQMSPYIIEEIRNSKGDLLYTREVKDAPQIYPKRLAEDMTGMLTRVVIQGTGGGARVGGWDVAGKTGTSQEWRDAWFIGYTAKYTAGVWVGNDDDKPMAKVTGGEMPARIFSTMMTAALKGIAPEPLSGAGKMEDYLSDDDYNRLNFYRQLASAFSQVEQQAGGGGGR
jgi:penicillin-binding protein 1A